MRAAAFAAAPISYTHTHTHMQRYAVVRKKRLSWYGSLKNARIYTYIHVCIHVCLPACVCVCVLFMLSAFELLFVAVCSLLLLFFVLLPFRLAEMQCAIPRLPRYYIETCPTQSLPPYLPVRPAPLLLLCYCCFCFAAYKALLHKHAKHIHTLIHVRKHTHVHVCPYFCCCCFFILFCCFFFNSYSHYNLLCHARCWRCTFALFL